MTPETPTPETDAAVIDGYTFCQEDMRPAIAFCANLERERDDARAEIEVMRAAIREAHDAVILGENPLPKLEPFLKP